MRPASFDTAEWIDAWRDRRPMTSDRVLVTFFYDGKMHVDTGRYVKSDYNLVGMMRTEGWDTLGTVLAWRPFPDPYIPEAVTNEDAPKLVIDAEGVRFENVSSEF